MTSIGSFTNIFSHRYLAILANSPPAYLVSRLPHALSEHQATATPKGP